MLEKILLVIFFSWVRNMVVFGWFFLKIVLVLRVILLTLERFDDLQFFCFPVYYIITSKSLVLTIMEKTLYIPKFSSVFLFPVRQGTV